MKSPKTDDNSGISTRRCKKKSYFPDFGKWLREVVTNFDLIWRIGNYIVRLFHTGSDDTHAYAIMSFPTCLP